MKVLILKGLPASGKSTFAKKMADEQGYKIVNKDQLRLMVDNGKWSRENEKFILATRNALILEALDNGYNVIVDDTNFAESHERDIRVLVEKFVKMKWKEVEIEVKEFNTPVLECIERDKKRDNPVGAKVIREMHNKYLKAELPVIVYNDKLPDTTICDLDGTLAIHNGRSPYDVAKCGTDTVNKPVRLAIRAMRPWTPCSITFVTGREEKFREPTEKWLEEVAQIGGTYRVLMRPTDDKRNDAIVKKEIYENEIKGKYNVVAVFDDRARVCRMWHDQGLPLFRVGDPDADF